jgi:hypothetical protein
LGLTGQELSLGIASSSANGALSSTDWTTFNNKQNALTNPVTGTGTAGQVAYFNGTSSITGEANLFWNSTDDRLGIGTATPLAKIHIEGSGSSYSTPDVSDVPGIYIHNTNSSVTTANTFLALRTTGAGGGDPILSWDINGVIGWSAGIDNSDGDSFKIANSWSTLDSNTRLRINGGGGLRLNAYGSGSNTGTVAYNLAVDSLGNVIEVIDGGGTVTGTGDANYIPKFTGTSTIGNSVIQEASSNIGIGVSPTYKLDVRGSSGAYWNGSTYTGGTPLAISITNTEVGGYDPVLIFQQTDSGGTSKNAGGIGIVGRSSWTSGNNSTQISDMYFLVRNDNGGISERMRLTSSGNLGLGVTPSAWDSAQTRVLELGTFGNYYAGYVNSSVLYIGTNSYLASDGWKYARTGVVAGQIDIGGGAFRFLNAPSGTAGNAISFTQAMTLGSNSGLSIGTPSAAPSQGLLVQGAATFSNQVTINGPSSDWAAIIQNTNSTSGTSYGLKVKAGTSSAIDATFVLQDYAGNEFFTARGNGRIGIGTNSPNVKFEVNGNIRVSSNGTNGGDWGVDDGGIAFSTQGSTPIAFWRNNYTNHSMRISAAGRLLINKTNDEGFTLDVNGTGRFSGALQVASNISAVNGAMEFSGSGSAPSTDPAIYRVGGVNSLAFAIGSIPRLTIASTGAATFSSSVTASGVRSINGGVDGTFADAFVGVYSSNNNEQNAIQTSVSSAANGSGFRFQVSNGGGSAGRTTVVDFLRDRAVFATNVGMGTNNPLSRLSVSGDATNIEGLVNINNSKSGGGVYFPALKVRNGEGNHSYGIVSEFSTGSTGGDRPSVLFYTSASNHSWTIGQVTSAWGVADSFAIGYRANNSPSTFGGWPSNYFAITPAGAATFSSSVTASSIIRSGGTSSQYLMADGSVSTLTNPVTGTGSGTTNTIPKFTGANALGNSIITDSGSLVSIDGNFRIRNSNGFNDSVNFDRTAINGLILNSSGNLILNGSTGSSRITCYGDGYFSGGVQTGLTTGASSSSIWLLGEARGGTVTTNATVRVEIGGVLVDLVARYV